MKLRKWSQFPTSEAGAKRVREPREIQQEVCIYAHKEQKELEATVHPVTLTLMGEPSQELLDYLGGGDDDRDKIKEEIIHLKRSLAAKSRLGEAKQEARRQSRRARILLHAIAVENNNFFLKCHDRVAAIDKDTSTNYCARL